MANDPKIAVPLTLDERSIDPLYLRKPGAGGRVDDPVLAEIQKGLQSARDCAQRALEVHAAVSADSTLMPAARQLKVAEHTGRLAAVAARKIDAARSGALAELKKIKTETTAPARPPGVDAVLEGEVRAALRGMSPPERDQAIADALAHNDSVVTRAVLIGPAFLSGLTPLTQAGQLALFRHRVHPQSVDRERRIGKAIEALDRGATSLIGFVRQLSADGRDAERISQHAADAVAKAVAKTGAAA